MSVQIQISVHNSEVARFRYEDRHWVCDTTQVVRGLDDPCALAFRVMGPVRARNGKGSTPSLSVELKIKDALQDAIEEFFQK